MTSTARTVLRSALKQYENCFKVASINPGSFVAHTDELRHIFNDTSLDALCVSETFFKGSAHNENSIGLKGFHLFRNDRLKEVYMRMGGVAIFVKSKYKCKIVSRNNDLVVA
jgi:exonuclease III